MLTVHLKELKCITKRVTGMEATLEAHLVACPNPSPAALRQEVMDLVHRTVANTGHPSHQLHLCRAEMAMTEKKWLEDNSGLRMRQCQSGLEQVQGEIKITREAIVRFQEGVEKVKGDQQYLGLKAIGAQGEMQRIHNKTDWLATSVGHTQKYGNGAAEGTGPRALPHGSRSATG